MEIVRGHEHARWRATAVAIGNFDGFHLGHRALIDRTRELAAAHDACAIALTFDPHPSAVVGSGAPRHLATLDRRLELLAASGLDGVVVEPFTLALAGRSPTAFIDDLVLGALAARAIVVGDNFNYGRGRAGTTDALRVHGANAGIEVAIVAAVHYEGAVVSSTRVRSALAAGDPALAHRLLGRPWDIDGVVVHGAKRGRAIGVPTANIAPRGDLLIAPGIYAVRLAVGAFGEVPALPAVASLGTNPTFVRDGRLVLEVHVLDWTGDIYDQTVRVSFVERLRGEATFASVELLLEQIARDIAAARQVFAGQATKL